MPARGAKRAAALLAAGIVTVAIPAAGCGGNDAGNGSNAPVNQASADTTTVAAVDFEFEPASLSVARGTRVTWTNAGETIHNVKGPGFFSDGIDPDQTYEHRFREPGTYRYLCTLHPTAMRGAITVRDEDR